MFKVWHPTPLKTNISPSTPKFSGKTLTILVHSNLHVKTLAKLREDPDPKKHSTTSLFPPSRRKKGVKKIYRESLRTIKGGKQLQLDVNNHQTG